jgi:transketolase
MSESTQVSLDQLCATTLRGLAIDAIQKANSGHPGMPMGMADAAHVLWSQFLKFDPSSPDWPDRDRFVLSAGHGSTLQYGLPHLYGFPLTIEDLKQFRQLHSQTPGHPERGHTPGIETTTGPLGQGLANAVGMALAEARLRAEFGPDRMDHYTYVIAGDGCMMEGVASEAASLAGHLGLDRLVVLYDDNGISIDGSTRLTFTEDVGGRFAAYDWHVQYCDGHDQASVAEAIRNAKAESRRPSLILCHTVIGKGSPKLAGSHKVHGAPLGADEVAATKRAIGLDPEQFFHVAPAVYAHLRARNPDRMAQRQAWEQRLASDEAGQRLVARLNPDFSDLEKRVIWPSQPVGAMLATRKAGNQVIQALAPHVPGLFGGSADLGHSTFATIDSSGYVQKGDYAGRNIHWGIREHAMTAAANGLSTHGGHVPFVSTFLVFHDYMRPSVRLAALMGCQAVHVYTHDSIFVGEDGPTHQPVETLAAMRVIPNHVTLRPADLAETGAAWKIAIQRTNGPTALSLTRQNLPELDHSACEGGVRAAVAKGAYLLQEAVGELKVIIVASGSEVHLAVAARDVLQAEGIGTRVVSMPSCELFDAQPLAYRLQVLPIQVRKLSIEAGLTKGWERYVGPDGDSIGIDTFGASAPDKVLAQVYGLTVDNVVAKAKRLLS